MPSPINDQYFDALNARLEACNVCSELQEQINTIFADLGVTQGTINAQIALLTPILALLEAPANPLAAVTWIANFITGFLTPYLVPYTTLAAQLAGLATQVATLTDTITTVASRIPNCHPTVPPLG